jgi:hypothetical protein
MTVADLIEKLKEFDPRLEIVFSQYSEYTKLESDMIGVAELYENGGYVSHAYRAKDQALLKPWLVFPGN